VCHGLIELGIQDHAIEICGDSRMVIEQMSDRWKISAGAYVAAALRAREMLRQFPNVRLVWIPRDQNRRADELSKRGLIAAGITIRPARGKRRAA
jgi:ribonuclease HI